MTRRLISLVVAATLVVGACAGSGDGDDIGLITAPEETSSTRPPRTTESTTTTADPDAELKAEVEAAYLASWDAFFEIYGEPNPSNPLIDLTYTGESRESVLDALSQVVLSGIAVRPPDDPADFAVVVHNVEIVGPSTAVVTACVVDGAVQYRPATGEVVNDDTTIGNKTVGMRREEGRWKVATVATDLLMEGSTCDDF